LVDFWRVRFYVTKLPLGFCHPTRARPAICIPFRAEGAPALSSPPVKMAWPGRLYRDGGDPWAGRGATRRRPSSLPSHAGWLPPPPNPPAAGWWVGGPRSALPARARPTLFRSASPVKRAITPCRTRRRRAPPAPGPRGVTAHPEEITYHSPRRATRLVPPEFRVSRPRPHPPCFVTFHPFPLSPAFRSPPPGPFFPRPPPRPLPGPKRGDVDWLCWGRCWTACARAVRPAGGRRGFLRGDWAFRTRAGPRPPRCAPRPGPCRGAPGARVRPPTGTTQPLGPGAPPCSGSRPRPRPSPASDRTTGHVFLKPTTDVTRFAHPALGGSADPRPPPALPGVEFRLQASRSRRRPAGLPSGESKIHHAGAPPSWASRHPYYCLPTHPGLPRSRRVVEPISQFCNRRMGPCGRKCRMNHRRACLGRPNPPGGRPGARCGPRGNPTIAQIGQRKNKSCHRPPLTTSKMKRGESGVD